MNTKANSKKIRSLPGLQPQCFQAQADKFRYNENHVQVQLQQCEPSIVIP